MNAFKKCDANNCLRASHKMSQHSSRPAAQASGDQTSETKPDEPWTGRAAFVDDFTREHSRSGMHLASVEILGVF